MYKEYSEEWKLRVCPSCGRLVLDGEVEMEITLEPPFINERCPFCGALMSRVVDERGN